MTIRMRHPEALTWRRMGVISMGWIREFLDWTLLEGDLASHDQGEEASLHLMEMRLDPHALVAPHPHDEDEIYFIAEGALHAGDRLLAADASIFIPAGKTYTFRTRHEPVRLQNFWTRADHRFHLPSSGARS